MQFLHNFAGFFCCFFFLLFLSFFLNDGVQGKHLILVGDNHSVLEEQAVDGNELSDVFGLVDASFNSNTLADLFSNKVWLWINSCN